MKIVVKILGCFLILLFLNGFAQAVLKKGEKFQPFSLIGIDDTVVTVKLKDGKLAVIKEFKKEGKEVKSISHPDAVLLDFWATWCVPCRKAMPHMQELFDKFKPEQGQDTGGLELFGIALDKKGSKIVKPFFQRLKKFTYPMLADPTSGSADENLIRTTEDMQSMYKVQGIPVVYVIDSKGIISHVHVGIKKEDMAELDDTIEELISEK